MKNYATSLSICRRISAVAAIASAVAMLTACGGGASPTATETAVVHSAIQVKDGYLVFADEKEFLETKTSLLQKTDAERSAWESQFSGFKSMRSDYSEAMASIQNLDEQLAGQNSASINLEQEEAKVEAIISAHKYSAVDIVNEDGTKTLEINANTPDVAPLVNHLGLVQIGDRLFHYSMETVKEAPAGTSFKDLVAASPFDAPSDIKIVLVGNNKTLAAPQQAPTTQSPVSPVVNKTGDESMVITKKTETVLEGEIASFNVELFGTSDSLFYIFPISIKDSVPHQLDVAGSYAYGDGAQVSKDGKGGYEVYVPAGVKKFVVGIPTTTNGLSNDSTSFKLQLGKYMSSTVFIKDGTPSSTGSIGYRDKQVQQTTDDGNHKLIITRYFTYTYDSAHNTAALYHDINMRSEVRGKVFKNRWNDEKTDMHVSWWVSAVIPGTGISANAYFQDYVPQGNASEFTVKKSYRMEYRNGMPVITGNLRAFNQYIPLIEIKD